MADFLVLPTLYHEILGINPDGGGILVVNIMP